MAKKDKEIRISYDVTTGIVDLPKMPKNEIEELINGGVICEVRVTGKTLYIANAYIIPNIQPNDTLFEIFKGVIRCSEGRCKNYSYTGDIHEDCNNCIRRKPSTKEEYGNLNLSEGKDNFVMGEPPKYDIEGSEEYMSYKKYLKTDYWKEFREKALDFYGEKCSWCGASGKGVVFNIHHIRYGTRFNEKLEDVIPLCYSCHQKAHGKG